METTVKTKLLSDPEATELLGLKAGTLAVWRAERRYPLPFVKIGRAVRFRVEDLDAFIASRTVGGSSDTG